MPSIGGINQCRRPPQFFTLLEADDIRIYALTNMLVFKLDRASLPFLLRRGDLTNMLAFKQLILLSSLGPGSVT